MTEPGTTRPGGRRPSRGLLAVVAATLAGGALFGAAFGFVAWRTFADAAEARVAERVLVSIPAGTGSRLTGPVAPGQSPAPGGLPPAAVRLTSGDTLVLRNDDTQAHQVGDYSIAPGAVLELTVGQADAGRFRCTFVQSGSFVLDVIPPLQPATLMVPAALIGMPVGGMFGLVGWFVRTLGGPDELGSRKEHDDA